MSEQPESREPGTVIYLPTAVWPAPEAGTATDPTIPGDTIPEARPAADTPSVVDSARLVLGPAYPDLMGDTPLVPGLDQVGGRVESTRRRGPSQLGARVPPLGAPAER